MALMMQDDFRKQAVQILKTNVENYPDSANAHISLSIALENNGDKDGAIAALEPALKLDPDNKAATERLETLRKK